MSDLRRSRKGGNLPLDPTPPMTASGKIAAAARTVACGRKAEKERLYWIEVVTESKFKSSSAR
jgi:hypothetical protein